MKLGVLFFSSLVVLTGCATSERARSIVAGKYVHWVPDHAIELALSPAGRYEITGTVWDGTLEPEVNFHEAGFWKIDGVAVILEPDPEAGQKIEYSELRRLFPLEARGKVRMLVPLFKGSSRQPDPFDFRFFEESFYLEWLRQNDAPQN